ncbi:unnamed protein product [Durusdinium trenchii]|uniref:UDP-glucose 4-epimerase (Galactowaldenase) (UDP-galactose 4-epimerase) n=2 Tax=Durusdinium trenchii TaxID=1381693 RepID=A0ABP0JIE0_9DINO
MLDSSVASMDSTEPGEQQGMAIGVPIRYFLLGDEERAQKQLALAKERCIASAMKRLSRAVVGEELYQQLQTAAPVLVTGSCGYLGSALLAILRDLGIKARGLDLMAPDTVENMAGDVGMEQVVQRAAEGCRSVIHAAALHAPNLDFYTEADYKHVNLGGTRHVLNVATAMGLSCVFSSTTSLMNTQKVKERSKSSTLVLKASEDYGTPRNIYGVTKKKAEQYCVDSGCSVAILRCSRFFAEDAYDTSMDPATRGATLSNGNVKANELLCGLRASLEDMVMAHLAALGRIATDDERRVLGPFIISACSPLLDHEDLDSQFFESAKSMYRALDWKFPQKPLGRILDSRDTWQRLNWQPRWDFLSLVRDFTGGANLDIIKDGSY